MCFFNMYVWVSRKQDPVKEKRSGVRYCTWFLQYWRYSEFWQWHGLRLAEVPCAFMVFACYYGSARQLACWTVRCERLNHNSGKRENAPERKQRRVKGIWALLSGFSIGFPCIYEYTVYCTRLSGWVLDRRYIFPLFRFWFLQGGWWEDVLCTQGVSSV